MRSLRTGLRRQHRFPLGVTLNVSDIGRFLGIERPISVGALTARLDSLPDSVPFQSIIVTGAPLGGEVDVTLKSDGNFTFSGFMRATGFPSYSFRLVAVVRSASNQVTVVAQHSGKVFGTDTPGDRQNNWTEIGTDQDQMKTIRNIWPDISGGTMVVNRSSELSGVLGTVVDVVKDVAEFFIAAAALSSSSIALCLVIGSELNRAGISLPGLGGVVGLGIIGGVVYIWGPSEIVPAIVAGVIGGIVVDSMVKIRSLTDAEIAFARTVFADSLDYDRIRLTNLSGLKTNAFTIPTVDGTILLNIGNAVDAPLSAVYRAYPVAGQILIHELTHAWQIEHASLDDGYVPGWLCSGITNQALISNPYQYGPPGQPWGCFHMEAQGAIVDQWFGGNGIQSGRPGMDPNSPYFGYITNNIRLGVS